MNINLFKEMKKKKIRQFQIAEMLNISRQSIISKLSGKTEFNQKEMFAIKEHFFPDLTLEYLFEKN